MDLKYIGHSAFEIKLKENSIMVDPFVSVNPKYDWHNANITDIFLLMLTGIILDKLLRLQKKKMQPLLQLWN